MGTRIEAAVATHRTGHLLRRGALHLSDAAAIACLHQSHHYADEIDLLINAGIYKNRNTAEPALASIIQEDIGANPGGPPQVGRHGTFSFDISNGGCGVITAAQVIDAFVAPGRAQLGMIVAADADPSPRTSREFPFSPAGGAMLVAHTNDDHGFSRFELRTFAEDAALYESTLRWDPHAGFPRRGRNVIEVKQAPELAARCLEHASDVVREVLADEQLIIEDIDLLITSQYPRGIGKQLAKRLGIPAVRVPSVPPALADAHTAGPIAALDAAMRAGRLAYARNVLFVTVGAGLTIGVALYRP